MFVDTADYVSAIKRRAIELNGTTVSVELSGGKTLVGTLAYVVATDAGGYQMYPDVCTVTVSSKAQTVRLDRVDAIGQG
ncbi:hypothetical protein C5L38_12915 [Streptomyces sp. WAC00288]|uniref:hypothetical protein n=1 Tax=unclassified Streptomyces TaxID=2593676 RepID=UPI000787A841|nr:MULTISPECIES: hypothetical protein [unclassified Streptomyces]AVH95865.1 hypothetical protein C5L38_12915 [Streptomyces sp. WAC00288]KYG54528.1 hypothetical protein AWI43_08730 [Streptomyces sp. WAC04657]